MRQTNYGQLEPIPVVLIVNRPGGIVAGHVTEPDILMTIAVTDHVPSCKLESGVEKGGGIAIVCTPGFTVMPSYVTEKLSTPSDLGLDGLISLPVIFTLTNVSTVPELMALIFPKKDPADG